MTSPSATRNAVSSKLFTRGHWKTFQCLRSLKVIVADRATSALFKLRACRCRCGNTTVAVIAVGGSKVGGRDNPTLPVLSELDLASSSTCQDMTSTVTW
jgi:hypothetical protein